MDISAIQSIQTRIAEIQKRFGIDGPVPGSTDFKSKLDAALKVPQAQPRIEEASTPANVDSPAKVHEMEVASDSARFIEEAAKKYGVDARLLSAVAEAESGDNQDAISPAGAIGTMQLMPETAASLGVDPYDKQQNIEGGAKYLRELLDTFAGDTTKAVAAYNAGPQAVKEYGGVPPYQETQNYVNKVLDLYQ